MYYEEKMVDGVLKCRTMPNGPWVIVTEKRQIEKLKKRNKELVKGLHDIIRHHKILSPTCYKKSAAAYIALGLVGDPND